MPGSKIQFDVHPSVAMVKHGFSPRMRRPMVARGEVRLCERNPWKHGNQILD